MFPNAMLGNRQDVEHDSGDDDQSPRRPRMDPPRSTNDERSNNEPMSSESKTLVARPFVAGFIAICVLCDFLMLPVFASINRKSGEFVFPFALGALAAWCSG